MDTKALRQKILDLAIRGKLVPQDPDDEPASVLLERIREEKKKMVKDGKLKAKDIKNDTIIFKGEDNLHYEKFQDGTVKCIEDEIPFEVPSGWCWARVNTIIDVRDGTHDTPKYVDEGVPLFTSKNLSPIGLDYSNVKYISYEDAKSINERSGVDKGDILYAMIGTIGNPTIVDSDIEMSIKNVALFKFSYSQNLSNRYMLYFFSYAQEYMKKDAAGGLQPFVSLTYLRNYLVPVPPVAEQARICAKCDLLVKNLLLIDEDKAELSDTVERAKSKILDLAIRGKLAPQDSNDEPASVLLQRIRAEKEELIKQGKLRRDKKDSIIYKGDDNSYYMTGKKEPLENAFDLPNGWIWASLPEVVFFQEGPGIMKKDFRDSGVPLIRISGLQTDKVSLEGCNFLDPEMVESKWKHFKLEMGDIVICTSASIGKVSIVDSETVGAIPYTGQIRFQMSPAITKDYFLYFAMSDIYLNQVNLLKTGNCIQHYGPTHLKQVIVPLPPIDEQIRISSAIKQYLMHLELISEQIY